MKGRFNNAVLAGLLAMGAVCLAGLNGGARAADAKPQLHIQAAEHTAAADSAMMLGATLAGRRIVAVGDHGVVLLSDDDGKTFRQARSVPVSSTLAGVSFADPRDGWTVGQWGVILKTTDGGDTWTIQRSDLSVDQPLFSVYFKNPQEGWAVGLWSLMLHTTDGGATWSTVQLPPPPGSKKADRNLYAIFADAKGSLFVACEQGMLLRSDDNGASWRYLITGYKGTFWAGIALNNGTILVGGLRGTVYRSSDDGQSWQASQSATKSSITDFVVTSDKIVATGLDGTLLESIDDGKTFKSSQREDRLALTAAVAADARKLVVFSAAGPVNGQPQ